MNTKQQPKIIAVEKILEQLGIKKEFKPMTAQQIESLMQWQAEQPESRVLKIEIGKLIAGKPAWVYDYNLGKGQLVSDASEIHLEEVVPA